ncbi:hypothetical protein NIES267_10590 [Calothrix parasitica NIES-267]|uniref:Uncharacterized protein n=1 Tax=Calothrix parasitica NIES-267 TaxID=1973488 RepID=A0A1Z4LK23_9CYAN|nr:hypothetical protein NIES267_10590 [Calothrix parasitica NIES-267]
MDNNVSIQKRTKRFAIRIINAYIELNNKPLDEII